MHNDKKDLITNKLLGLILVSLLGAGLPCAAMAAPPSSAETSAPQRPRLVVGIMVEGLDADYIELLRDKFTKGGFNRLLAQGLQITDVDYGTRLDPAAATAVIYTGASPAANGVPARYIYDTESRRAVLTLTDPSKIGNFTDVTLSPAAISVSTIGDEVRLDAAGTGWVYSIAPDPSQAIIMAGHAGNSAVWLDDKTERWATTTHYKDLPQTLSSRNYRNPLSARIDTMSWSPLLPSASYPDIPAYKIPYPYRHTFSRKDIDRFDRFKESPKVNTEVTDLARDYLTTMPWGTRGAVDMLNIAYTLAPYTFTRDNDNRLETLDAYVRLDRDLERLFNTIDSKAGAGNALVFLVGHPAPTASRREDDKWGIPTGEFSARKAMSLLNTYLMALHGNGEWISGYYNCNFYLNRKTIKNASLDPAAVRAEAAEFLARMSGVSHVYTIDDIIASRAGDNAAALKRNTDVRHTGDIIVAVNPGWEIVDDTNTQASTSRHTTVRDNFTASPAFIMAPSLAPQRITTPVDARAIAPTVSRLMRIRSPNAASLPAVRP